MTCSAIAAIAGAVSITLGADQLVLAPHPTASAQLCYHNAAEQQSGHGYWRIAMGGMVVTGYLTVVAAGEPETLTVNPPTGHWIWPADAAISVVPDGGTVTMLVMRGMS
jgi:hypothetical protein